MDRNDVVKLIQSIAITIVFYLLIVLMVQAAKCKDLRGMELLNYLDEAAAWNFKEC